MTRSLLRYSQAVNADDLRKLEAAGAEAEFPAGCVFIERGQFGTGLYVILEGTALVEAPEGTRELGPLITGIMLAARIGAAS